MSDNENISEHEAINPRAHRLLVDNVARLHNAKHTRKPTRTEPTTKRSEFHLAKTITDHPKTKGEAKVNVSDLIDVLDKTNKHVTIGKTLKKVERKQKLLKKPLEKPAAERLKRAIGYEKTKEQLLRWDAIVAKNRSSDHLEFPLKQDLTEIQFKDSYQIPSEFRIKSDMMREMEAIAPEIFHIGKPELQNEEEVREKLTRAEMIERNQELRRLRMKEAQQSAKAHRQNKIKSKKYHRILKKERLKQQIKEFEQLQKTDPEAALRKIEQLDRNRVEERANQRHRNTGTWAKNLQVRAKYNKEVRKELADQIAISRELVAKRPIDESDEEDGNNDAEKDINYDPFNPWLKKESEEDKGEIEEVLGGYRQYWLDRNESDGNIKQYLNAKSVDIEQRIEPTKANGGVQAGNKGGVRAAPEKLKRGMVKGKLSRINKGWIEEDLDSSAAAGDTSSASIKQEESLIVDNLDDFFDDAEDALREKFSKKASLIYKQLDVKRKNKRQRKRSSNDDKEIDLKFKQRNKRPKIDEELTAGVTEDNNEIATAIQTARNKLARTANGNGHSNLDNINPNEFAKVQPRHLQTALPDTIYTNDDDGLFENNDEAYENDDIKRLTLAEAFEDDDIVAQFERDKDEEAKKGGPQEIDMSMPGWGSWAGCGIDPAKQKTKRRMILKFPAAEKRKPENKGNVVIIENGDEKLKKHRVADLPFPFTSVADYEQSIRAPLGNDFVPVTAHKLLTKPAVTTRLGSIIDPMNENMLVKPARPPLSKTAKKIAQLEEDKF